MHTNFGIHKGNHTMQTIDTQTLVLTPDLFAVIDEAGAIHAEIARLTKQLDTMKARIKATGTGKVTGFNYESNVFEKAVSDKIDWQSIAMHFEPSRQLITAHTKAVPSQIAITFTKV